MEHRKIFKACSRSGRGKTKAWQNSYDVWFASNSGQFQLPRRKVFLGESPPAGDRVQSLFAAGTAFFQLPPIG